MIKHLLQFLMAIISFIMVWDMATYDGTLNTYFEVQALIFVFYGLIWLLSMYLMFFEYKRGLPHAWYTHQMFWVWCALSNIIQFFALCYCLNLVDFDDHTITRSMKIKWICCYSFGIVMTISLSVLGIKYKREAPQHLRNYIPLEKSVLKDSNIQERLVPKEERD